MKSSARASSFFQMPGKLLHPKPQREKAEQMLAASVFSKLEDGNIRTAVIILMSDEEPVSPDLHTYQELLRKHPAPSKGHMPQASDCPPLQVSEEDVRSKIRSFSAGSSRGPDGLRPQIVTEFIACSEAGSRLLSAISGLISDQRFLSGKCPDQERPILFGEPFWPYEKKPGIAPNRNRLFLAPPSFQMRCKLCPV